MWVPYRKPNTPIVETLISPLPIRHRPHSIAHMTRALALTESRTPPHPRCCRRRQGHLLPPALWTPAALRPSPTQRRLHRQKKSHHISTSGGAQIHICERRHRASHRRGTSRGVGSLPDQPRSHHRPRVYGPRWGRARPSRPHDVSAAKPSDQASACRLQVCTALVLLVLFNGEPCCCLPQIC